MARFSVAQVTEAICHITEFIFSINNMLIVADAIASSHFSGFLEGGESIGKSLNAPLNWSLRTSNMATGGSTKWPEALCKHSL